jgi:hypothetical protein
MQLVVSIALIVVGVAVGLVVETSRDMHIFGWVLVGVGVLALLTRWLISQQNQGRERPRRPR